jgi:valine--pyruvate aminotransferase
MFSDIGARLSGPSGIQELMDDLGNALSTQPDMRMLGGGQPAAIPEVQALWRQRMSELLADGATLDRALLNYEPPLGNPFFRESFAHFLNRECGWEVTREHIAVLPSSQTAMFLLIQLFSGATGGGMKRILFPLMPDYIGYASQGLVPGQLTACLPVVERRGVHEIKYRIDFDAMQCGPEVGAIALSCPTNPTGNVITQEEFLRLHEMAQARSVPLILDNAYGHPFPGVLHTDFRPQWQPGMIFSISMSKVGLPGVRTAMVVAEPHIIRALGNMNASLSLANGNLGQALMLPYLKDDTLLRLGREVIKPFYAQRSAAAVQVLQAALAERTEWALHAQEGAFFLWLWLPRLKIPAAELYECLKARKVLVIPGHYFAYGLETLWSHASQCLRLTYSQPTKIVQEGLEILAQEAVGASS